MLNFFQGKFQNNKVCYFQTNVATARLECKKKNVYTVLPVYLPTTNIYSLVHFDSNPPNPFPIVSTHAPEWGAVTKEHTREVKNFKKKSDRQTCLNLFDGTRNQRCCRHSINTKCGNRKLIQLQCKKSPGGCS